MRKKKWDVGNGVIKMNLFLRKKKLTMGMVKIKSVFSTVKCEISGKHWEAGREKCKVWVKRKNMSGEMRNKEQKDRDKRKLLAITKSFCLFKKFILLSPISFHGRPCLSFTVFKKEINNFWHPEKFYANAINRAKIMFGY